MAEKRRLRRARAALARRLVAIYESGTPSEASVILASSDFDDLATRTDYLAQIEEFDRALARRVDQVRDGVRGELREVADLKRRADAYNERLVAARSEISAVRGAGRSGRRRPAVGRRRAGRLALDPESADRDLGRATSKRRKRRAAPPPKKRSGAGSAAPTRSRPTS